MPRECTCDTDFILHLHCLFGFPMFSTFFLKFLGCLRRRAMAGFISKVPHDRARPVSDVITISLSYINTILY